MNAGLTVEIRLFVDVFRVPAPPLLENSLHFAWASSGPSVGSLSPPLLFFPVLFLLSLPFGANSVDAAWTYWALTLIRPR